MEAIYALRHLVKAVEGGKTIDLDTAITQAKVVLNKLNHSTR